MARARNRPRDNPCRAAVSGVAMMLVLAGAGIGLAHAELTIYQVENNPPGQDRGNEWLW